MPCPPQDPNAPIYAITDGQFLVDETGGVLPQPTGRQALLGVSSATLLQAQADAVANLITQVQATEANQSMAASAAAMDASSPPMPGDGSGGGDSGTNSFTPEGSGYTLNPGTNLWVAQVGVTSGCLVAVVSNSNPDILYEVQGCSDLGAGNWTSCGFVDGSELTNWTAMSVPVTNQGNMFFRIRSWEDSTDSGIPDWWWFQYFGQITNVDENASAAGDGYSNWDKFQMGLNPTNYYNPNAPTNFFGCLDMTGTNVVLEWSPSPGPVVYYLVQRGIRNTSTGKYDYSQLVVSSNAVYFKDTGAISNNNAWNNIYRLQAVYPGNSLTATDSWEAWRAEYDYTYPPYGAPVPNEVYAYELTNGTDVFLSWTPSLYAPTGYMVGYYSDAFYSLAVVGANTTSLVVVGGVTNSTYGVIAAFPGGGVSCPAMAAINTSPPPPTGLSATVDSTGTNIWLSWTPPQGVTVSNYIILRGVYDTTTSSYVYTQIGQVDATTTMFEDVGAITSGSYNYVYQVIALYPDGSTSPVDGMAFSGTIQRSTVQYNLYLTAYLVRNGTGRWQVMFSGYPTNSAQ